MLFNSLSHNLNFKEAESSRFQVRKKQFFSEEKKKEAELFVDLELLWLVLFFNQHLQAQLIPIFLHVTQLFILLPVFSWVYKFIFHSKCGAQANLEKHLSPFVLLKSCLCPQEKSTYHSWKWCYTCQHSLNHPTQASEFHNTTRMNFFMSGFHPSSV